MRDDEGMRRWMYLATVNGLVLVYRVRAPAPQPPSPQPGFDHLAPPGSRAAVHAQEVEWRGDELVGLP